MGGKRWRLSEQEIRLNIPILDEGYDFYWIGRGATLTYRSSRWDREVEVIKEWEWIPSMTSVREAMNEHKRCRYEQKKG